MQKWEYLRVIIDGSDGAIYKVFANDDHIFDRYDEHGKVKKQPVFDFNQYLKVLGGDGWELINAMPIDGAGYTTSVHLYLKRPIE